jgi:predicted nuclease of predicted toxin-antitoxin system
MKLTKKLKKTRISSKNSARLKRQMSKHPHKSLRLYFDESVNVAVPDGLKSRGIVAISAKDLDKLGLTDEEQLETATLNKAVIFTHDADFLRIVSHKNHFGIIYVHQQKLSVGECVRKLKLIAETIPQEKMCNKVVFL